jgi:hypothetical protein
MNKDAKVTKAAELLEIVSNPEFQQLINEIDNQPKSERLEYAMKNASVEKLRSRGMSLPEDFKLSVRIFEGSSVTENFENDKTNPPVHTNTWTLCFGYIATLGYTWEK